MFKFNVEGLGVSVVPSAATRDGQVLFAVRLKDESPLGELVTYLEHRNGPTGRGWWRGGHLVHEVLEVAVRNCVLRHLAEAWLEGRPAAKA